MATGFGVVQAPLWPVEPATVTVTGDDVWAFPDESRAAARIVCVPLPALAVFQVVWYGAAASSDPTLMLSTVNQTLETPTLSDAEAISVTVPPTVAPLVGLVAADFPDTDR